MTGRSVQLDHVTDAFEASVDSTRGLVAATNAFPTEINPSVAVGLHLGHKRYVVNLALAVVESAREEFRERALVRYVANGFTRGGFRPN